MPPRDWIYRLRDILDSIESIENYTAGMNGEMFDADRKTVDAVVRRLIIIGEAAAHVPEEFCDAHAEIAWREMRDMRNFVVHRYFGVSTPVIWETVSRDLPTLKHSLAIIITSL